MAFRGGNAPPKNYHFIGDNICEPWSKCPLHEQEGKKSGTFESQLGGL